MRQVDVNSSEVGSVCSVGQGSTTADVTGRHDQRETDGDRHRDPQREPQPQRRCLRPDEHTERQHHRHLTRRRTRQHQTMLTRLQRHRQNEPTLHRTRPIRRQIPVMDAILAQYPTVPSGDGPGGIAVLRRERRVGREGPQDAEDPGHRRSLPVGQRAACCEPKIVGAPRRDQSGAPGTTRPSTVTVWGASPPITVPDRRPVTPFAPMPRIGYESARE